METSDLHFAAAPEAHAGCHPPPPPHVAKFSGSTTIHTHTHTDTFATIVILNDVTRVEINIKLRVVGTRIRQNVLH